MARGKRKTIILNPENPKENSILKLLAKQYNESEFIKNLLFDYVQKENNSILHDDNTMAMLLPHNDNSITNVLSSNDNTITTSLSHVGNDIINELQHNDNSSFLIDLNNVSDVDANINASTSEEDPSKNALEFLKHGF